MNSSLPSLQRFLSQTACAAYLLALVCAVLGAATPAHAQDRDDTRLRLDHVLEQKAAEKERNLLKDELDPPADAAVTVDSSSSPAADAGVDAIGQALYQAITGRQWRDVAQLLQRYQALPGHDPMLRLYAQGALARSRGDLTEAEQHYRELLELQADFLPGRLELARVLFENQLDREAAQQFERIASSLDPFDPKTEGVRKTVASFQQALAHRRAWQGSFALGPSWSDNLNQSSESRTCLLMTPDGLCVIERSLPDALHASGVDFDAAINKRLPLRGHHGLFLRSLLYGYAWDQRSDYNEATVVTNAGYSYASAKHSYSISPSFEFNTFGNDALYGAWGLRAEWTYTWSPKTLLKIEGDYKRMRYRRHALAHNDGDLSSVYVTVWRVLPAQWMLFGGADLVERETRYAVDSYLQQGLRLGLSKQFQAGFSAVVFASLRRREHDAFSELLEAQRRDNEQNYTVIVRMPRFKFAGLTPSFTYKYNRVSSNVDWLYSYDKNVVSLKLERSF